MSTLTGGVEALGDADKLGGARGDTFLVGRFPARMPPWGWPATGLGRAEVVETVRSAAVGATGAVQAHLRRGLPLLLDWLGDQPGDTWQERWLAAGADAAGDGWAEGPAAWLEREGLLSRGRLELMTSSLLAAVGADIVRPSPGWLLTGGKKRKVVHHMVRWRDPEGFERLRVAAERDPSVTPQAEMLTLFRAAVVVAAKGGDVSDITAGDMIEVLELEGELRGQIRAGSASFRVLRELGIFGPGVPTLREIRSGGQRSVPELVDRYRISTRGVRDLLVDYLQERRPALDYNSLVNHSYALARCFWSDIEAHHPGTDTLALPNEVASAWKQRLRTRIATSRTPGGDTVTVAVERLSYLDILATVRAFYLDVSQWALDDPARWAQWAAPCPISAEELTRRKAVRQRKARMDTRTRQRLPVLPVLARTVDQWRQDAAGLLAAGRAAAPGQEFTVAGQTLRRARRPHAHSVNVWAEEPTTGRQRLLNREEEHAFWAWAVIEVLRHTGIRVEELLELSHHSLVQYRLPTTGELIPLLQIAPSKTDAERLMVVSPELADVLSAIIVRLRNDTGAVPLVRARDAHERRWSEAAPLLFQRRHGAEHHSLGVGMIGTLLDEAINHAGLSNQADGTPLRCTPHDFRRMFITDAIRTGLPPHIAQIIAGHRDINVTMGYNAIYPEEAIQAHLGFLARRRAQRPAEEYRIPTDEEWQQFLGHFERRKVSVGTCARAFATPCIHEHACVRCSMLWPDPAQRDRLVDIRDNLVARIQEAETQGWLGELEGLRISLAGATDKIAHIDNRSSRARPVELRSTRTTV
jgi:integrase